MREEVITIYKYDELPTDEAKEKAREWMREGEAQDWHACLEPAETAAKALGIDLDSDGIHYSGFYSQGDGASWEGTYAHVITPKNILQRIKAEFPTETALHKIASGLAALQRKYDYKLTARVKQRGHYSHKYTMYIDTLELQDDSEREIKAEDEEALLTLFRDFAQWIYEGLEQDYEFCMSDKQLVESIEANEYEFTEDGERAA